MTPASKTAACARLSKQRAKPEVNIETRNRTFVVKDSFVRNLSAFQTLTVDGFTVSHLILSY